MKYVQITLIWIILFSVFFSQYKSFKYYCDDNLKLDTVSDIILKEDPGLEASYFTLDLFLSDNLEFKLNKNINNILCRNDLFPEPRLRISEKKFPESFQKQSKNLIQILKNNNIQANDIYNLYHGLCSEKNETARYSFLIGAYLFSHLDFWPDMTMKRDSDIGGIKNEFQNFKNLCDHINKRSNSDADISIFTAEDLKILNLPADNFKTEGISQLRIKIKTSKTELKQ